MKIREHVKLRDFSLQSSDHEAFVSCKFKVPSAYLVWRVFWAVYHSSWLIGTIIVASLQEEANVFKWFIYLSNWMYVVLTIECVTEAAVVVYARKRKIDSNRDTHLSWYIQVVWLLYTVSVVGAVMVSLWYWTLIHKGKQLTAIRFNTHAVAAIYVILNMAITRLPLRLLHFLYPVGFGVAYTLFTVIYYSLGGTNKNGDDYIYSILDWSRPGRTLVITSLSNFILIPVVHVLLWALNLCFHKLNDRFRQRHVVYSQRLDGVDGGEVDIV